MKKVFFAIAFLAISLSLFADGDKNKSLGTMSYNPDPSSGNVVPALNLYGGFGRVRSSNLGFSIAGDYEIPVIDPNFTIGPGFGVGFHYYPYGYWKSGTWYTGTGQLSLYGGVVARYYADWLIPSMPDEFDVFITSNMGAGFIKYFDYYSSKVFFDFGTSVGGRWNFSEKVSLYAQVGYGTSNILAGISFKM